MLRKIQPGARKVQAAQPCAESSAAWQGRAEREDGGRRGRISEAGG